MDAHQESAAPVVVSGLADNVAGALAYVTIIPAIIFLVVEPYSRRYFVRYNAFQCLALAILAFACSLLLVIPILGWIAVPLLDIGLFVLWLVCIWNAWQGKVFRLPIVGPQIETLARQ
jgi:uncharacterized membrane protein